MEAIKETPVLSDGLIKGKWQLTYKLTNELGINGFSGKMLGAYRDPLTAMNRELRKANGLLELGFFLQDVHQILDPERNPDHRLLVDWLVGHPEVGIDNKQCRLPKEWLSHKISNPRFKLINLDHQDVVDLEEEDYIDKLIGIVSLDTGNKAIGIEKLRHVLSRLDLSYRDEKYITDPVIEKKKLRKRLKTFIRSSYDNAKKVSTILDNLQSAKIIFEVKEMLRLGILFNSRGTYMYEGNPIGISYESLIAYFENNPEFYIKLTERLYEELNAEANHK